MFGNDYGLKDRVVTVADFEYQQHLRDAECVGLAYGVLPIHKDQKNLPFACLICKNIPPIIKAFGHFKDWITRSKGNSEALQVSFIRLATDGYKICIYPQRDCLLERCCPEWMQDDVESLLMISSYIKGFDSHGAYEPLKELAKTSPILFCYGELGSGEPVLNDGIILTNIKFMSHSEVTTNSMEIGAVREPGTKNSMKQRAKQKFLSSQEALEMKRRRIRRLKAYFPVTLEYVNQNTEYLKTVSSLKKEGITDWQIKQALCNIVLSSRLTGTLTFEKIDTEKFERRIADYLSNNREDPLIACPAPPCFNLTLLRNQVINDQKRLLQEFMEEVQNMGIKELQIEISKLGLL